MSLVQRCVRLLPGSWVIGLSGARRKYRWLAPIFDRVAGNFRNRDSTIGSGPGKGLKYNPGPTATGYLLGVSEPALQRALATVAKPGTVIWDLGANAGFYGVLAAHFTGPTGKVICFEPIPKIAEQVRYNAKLNGFESFLTARAEAIGREDGSTNFVIPVGQCGVVESSSFNKGDVPIGESLTVPIRSIDSLVSSGDVPAPAVIKMDIEGVEVEGLRGGAETIAKYRPILLVECHGTNAAVASELDALGYHAVVIEGDGAAIATSFWNSHVAAVPKDSSPELLAVIDGLTKAVS